MQTAPAVFTLRVLFCAFIVASAFYAELIDRLFDIHFSGAEHGGRPLGMVGAVGEMLGLQGYGFSGAGIALDAGLGGEHFHFNAGLFGNGFGALL